MYVDSKLLSPDSRVWVYQASRLLTESEETNITLQAKEFIGSWTAHDMELKAGFEIRHHVFLIFILDEKFALASGCSIDKSVHFIQKVEKDYSVSLLDRMIFAFKNNDAIQLVKRNEFNNLMEAGKINDDTIVFNNLIKSKRELDSVWEIPLSKSWHKVV